ncbi:MAG: AAA family ATPase [Oligoflexia bacterium]|nr:AAA family ATPase [Oligoflexia bacterium]
MYQFDSITQGSINIAQTEALKRKNLELYPEHLLLGLIKNPATYSSRVLKKYLDEINKLIDSLPQSSNNISLENLRANYSFSEWLTNASSHATESGRQEILERDLLRFLPKFVPKLKIDYNDLNNLQKNNEEEKEEVPQFLTNLNELAEQGKLDPVIGRTKEIRALMEILGRRNKNNPVLVGGAGVGKTVIVEGLAEMIVKGKVPDMLKGKTIYALSMGALMAGTKFRGEFEERIVKLLKFIKDNHGEFILFIDEIHLLVGAGKTEGAMDAANLLKPALARGELHCIGATTPEEYQKYILSDSALDRRFRSIPVNEPSKEDTIEILMGIKEKQEIHHGVKISDEAIYQAVVLSDQYITDKNLPDKAIDLIDEASAALKLSTQAMPAHLVELESEIRSKIILSQVEKSNKDILAEIKILQQKFNEGKKLWEEDVLSLKKVSGLKNQLDRLKFDLETAERKQNYEEASRIKYSLLPQIEKELAKYSHGQTLLVEHIAQVISRQTGIPLEKILKSKQERVLELAPYLKTRIFGQDEVIDEICEILMAAHAGLTDVTRPLGSFMLLGPTGVGKTETVKGVAQFLFNSEKNIIRLDMSEFSEKHSVAKLIGAPAGYIGYDDGGVLTEAVRKHPYSVILFDEIEKAHLDFSDILLQILDDGRLTDNKGRTINFKNTIIFMTSNSKNIYQDFKSEVLGRIDEILYFKPLKEGVIRQLINKQLHLLNERLRSKKVEVALDESVYKIIEENGYIPEFGARPLQSVFNKFIVRPLSEKIIRGQNLSGVITLRWGDGHIIFN